VVNRKTLGRGVGGWRYLTFSTEIGEHNSLGLDREEKKNLPPWFQFGIEMNLT